MEGKDLAIWLIEVLFNPEFLEGNDDSDERIMDLLSDSIDCAEYTAIIDESFSTEQKNNIFYNIGYLNAVNHTELEELEERGKIIDKLDEHFPCEGLSVGYLDGLEYEITEALESKDEAEVASVMMLRALTTKFCLDNIRSLLM